VAQPDDGEHKGNWTPPSEPFFETRQPGKSNRSKSHERSSSISIGQKEHPQNTSCAPEKAIGSHLLKLFLKRTKAIARTEAAQEGAVEAGQPAKVVEVVVVVVVLLVLQYRS
jgi:hypothetical protein